mgnify:CR=1 FL=1
MPTWSATYREHAPGLRAFLRRRLRSAEQAEDLTQETFVRAMRAEDRIEDESKVRAYLYRIATNLVLNLRRRPAVVTSESDLGDDTDLDALAASPSASPEQAAEVADLERRIEAVLTTLPADQAQAFRWGVLERMPYAAIRERTGWSASKVKISVFRARKAVIAELTRTGDALPR